MAIDPSKIAKAIRAAQATKKKTAKISKADARLVASKMNQRIGGSKPLSRPRGSGNIATRPSTNVSVAPKKTFKSIPKKTERELSKEKAKSEYFKKEKIWSSLQNPPKVKPKVTNVLHDRPITKRQLEMNKFALKRNLKERRKIEKTYKGIRKGRVQESRPGRSMFEREMNIPAGTGPKVRLEIAKKELKREVQLRKEGKVDWQRQARDAAISPKKTLHPSATEKSWQSDRNAIKAVREAERLAKANKTRDYRPWRGRPNKNPGGK